ncbi:MAG: flagellar hook capping FlgD N-terminal domain-containing protein [Desulfobacterales bacterium]|jgi:flagellar basal-body rod modification protein FlgD
MTIAGVTSHQSPTGEGTAKAPDALGRDDFLNLLVTQLQYQDPLNPMDSTDFTAQLAQFSSLEQLTNVNDQLVELTATQTELNNAQAVAYIGRTVLSKGNAIQVTEGSPEPLQLNLEAPAAEVFVSVYDAVGNLRSSFKAGAMPAGRGTVAWTGTDMDNNPLPDGPYRFEVAAINEAGNEIQASPLSGGRVTGVAFEDGEAALVVNGQSIRMTDVVEVVQGRSGQPGP